MHWELYFPTGKKRKKKKKRVEYIYYGNCFIRHNWIFIHHFDCGEKKSRLILLLKKLKKMIKFVLKIVLIVFGLKNF
jgi:hypothetical protein